MTVVITAPPPTPNGRLHLGHAAGPYLAADVAARHLRRNGHSTLTVCGSDAYQDYVDRAAQRAGREVEAFAADMAGGILADFDRLGITWDVFSRPDVDADYSPRVTRLYDALRVSGAIRPELRAVSSCWRCQRVLRYVGVAGRCAHCLAHAAGGACEGCGHYNQAHELKDARSTCCRAQLVETKRCVDVFVPKWASLLTDWLPDMSKSTPAAAVRGALLAAAIDASSGYVCALPWDGSQRGVRVAAQGTSLIVDVWFEMGLYYASLLESTGHFDQLWHFLGVDNRWFYAGLFPALYAELGVAEPGAVRWVINYFLLLDGEKFSTSRRHAVWVEDVPSAWTTDALRYLLAQHYPSVPGVSFSREVLEVSPEAAAMADGVVHDSLLEPADFDLASAVFLADGIPCSAVGDDE